MENKYIKMKYYTIMQIAKICKVSQKTVRRQIAAGLLTASRKGNQYRIEENDFLNWKQKNDTITKKNEIPQKGENLVLFPVPNRYRNNRTNGKTRKRDIVNWIDIRPEWEKTKFDTTYTYVDLFSGAGGISCGFDKAGLQGIAALEFMRQAVETYRNNFTHPVIYGDITNNDVKKKLFETVSKQKTKKLDIIAGGFPCQGFSMSGHRIVDDSRNKLYGEMLNIVKRLRPSFIVMENVVGLRSMLDGKVEEKIIKDYEGIGYKINVTILNAADYYTPQIRKRVIFIGNCVGRKNYHPKPLLHKGEYVTTRQAIEDLMYRPEDKSFNHVLTKHNKDMILRLGKVREGESLYSNYSDAWKRCPWDKPSCTIKENHGGVNIHPQLPRVLTAREMARLQSFPDTFIFQGAKKWQLVQIGNAVPPNMARAIGLALRKSLED